MKEDLDSEENFVSGTVIYTNIISCLSASSSAIRVHLEPCDTKRVLHGYELE